MMAVSYPPDPPFVVADDHPNRHAHDWLTSLLDRLDWTTDPDYHWSNRQANRAIAELKGHAGAFRIAVLKACLERMVWHREQRASTDGLSVHYYIGSVLYGLACHLYQQRLPYSENDICEILRQSRHSCGHGGDVKPPFHIAVQYARANEITTELLAAVKDFMNGLKGVGAAQVTHLKRKLGLLLVLDAESKPGKTGCWSDRFRTGLSVVPTDEQARWRRLVLGMTTNDLYVLPKTWRREATKFIQEVGPDLVVQRLSAWWPDPTVSAVWPIQTGGSHLLKHFVWLLDVTATMSDLGPKCVELVCRLSEFDWKPRERGQKVMIAATAYLRSFPPDVAWPALQRLAQWSAPSPGDGQGNKIGEFLRSYCAQHKLTLPEQASA